jgi:hypothetical protein
MWLFTRYGFYSISCARKPDGSPDAETMMIHARRKAHLEHLQCRFPAVAALPIVALRERDYRYRLIVPKAEWTVIMGALAAEQKWSNFKNEAARFQGVAGSEYVNALHRVWEVMYDLQSSEQRSVSTGPAKD